MVIHWKEYNKTVIIIIIHNNYALDSNRLKGADIV